MKRIFTIIILGFIMQGVMAQPSITWQKTYGGSDHEYCWKTIATSDGGYAFVGFSDSNDGDVNGESNGGTDLWVAKINSTGAITWSYLFGGTGDDEGADLMQTSDNGFLVVGYTGSSDGDVTGHHGTSGNDLWVLKLSSAGALEWNNCYGGSSNDEATSMAKTSTGDYYIAGTTYSTDGDVSGNHGASDAWIIKINSSGTLLNQLCVGGSSSEEGYRVIITSDDGCLLAGRTSSSDGDAVGYHGGSDMILAKLNSSLAIEWSKCYGGTETEECNDIVQLSDGSYAALGYCSTHNNGDITGHHGAQGSDDFWLLKLTSAGAITWAKCYGGDGDDQANGLAKTADGGFVMCGLTNSTNGDVLGFHSALFEPDIWVAKVDASGDFQWQRCCGGTGQDESFNVFETSPDHYIVTGFSYSTDYDVTQNRGSADGWIIDLSVLWSVEENMAGNISVYPNPFKDEIGFTLNNNQEMPEKIIITDVTGRQIMIVDDASLISKQTINTSCLDKGVYFIEIEGKDYKVVRKVVKQ